MVTLWNRVMKKGWNQECAVLPREKRALKRKYEMWRDVKQELHLKDPDLSGLSIRWAVIF